MTLREDKIPVTAPAPAQTKSGRLRRKLPEPSPLVCWAILALTWLAATAFLLWLHRGLTFAVDEFDFSETAGTGSLVDFLAPKNGHLIVLPLLLYRGLYILFGTDLAPFTLIEGAMLAAVSAGLYVFSRERVGRLLALVPAVLPLFLGSAWPMLMPPMIGLLWIVCIAAGLWALILVERDARSWDAAACALLCVALATFSLGFVFLAACAVACFLSPRRWKRLYVVAVPAAAWFAWHLWARKFGPIGAHPSYLVWLPAYGVDSIAADVGALFGRTLAYGPATSLQLEGFGIHRFVSALELAAIESLVLLAIAARVGFAKLNRPAIWIVLVLPLAWWASQVVVLDELRTPGTDRYFFAGAIMLLMVAVEVARGVRATPLAVGAVFALAGVGLFGNVVAFRDGRAALRELSLEAKADMAVVELEGRKGDQSFTFSSEVLTPQSAFMFLNVGRYLQVVDRYGSPADSLSELSAAPASSREAADVIAARLLRLELAPTRRAAPDCQLFVAASDAANTVVPLPRGGAVLRSGVSRSVWLGRFADGFPIELGELKSGAARRLAIPTDRSRRPWTLVAAGTRPISVCPFAG